MISRRQMLFGGGALAPAYWLGQASGMEEYDASVASTRAALSARPSMQEFIRYATLAASGHNTQPWLFHVADNRIDISADFTRRTPVVDPDDHHLFLQSGMRG